MKTKKKTYSKQDLINAIETVSFASKIAISNKQFGGFMLDKAVKDMLNVYHNTDFKK